MHGQAHRNMKPWDTIAGSGYKQVTRMGNKSTSGIFVPLVKVTRAVIGKQRFTQLRGKGISLHSQGTEPVNFVCCERILVRCVIAAAQHMSLCCTVIKSFGKRIGADGKQVQGLVRLAKQNGEKLGFLA